MPKNEAFEYVSTIVSFHPVELKESKPHLLPSEFIIKAALDGGFSITHISEAIHYVPNPLIDEGKPGSMIKQTITPPQMAKSIVDDFLVAQIATDSESYPGMFVADGKMSESEVRTYYKEELSEAKARQMRWYRNLVRMADSDWNKNKNILAVSDLQKIAANAIGHKADWVNYIPDPSTMPTMIDCPFCFTKINALSAKCINCREVVNQKEYDKIVNLNKADSFLTGVNNG